MRHKPLAILIVLLCVAAFVLAATHHRHSRIHRSRTVRAAFMRAHPCPANGKRSGPCPGYVVDHIKPLACGGPDDPSNLQWQTVAEGKAKDRWERKGCDSR